MHKTAINLADLDGIDGFFIEGVNELDDAGRAVSAAGDLNNDGVLDLAIGANFADPGGRESAGAAYVVFGNLSGFPSRFPLSNLDGTNGFVMHGQFANDTTGISVGSAGDIDNDGIDDLIIGAHQSFNHLVGRAYIIYGRNTSYTSPIELGSMTVDTGFIIEGVDTDDFTGIAVSGIGDINNDTIDDIVIGAPHADGPGNAFGVAGAAYVIFGQNGRFTTPLNLSSLDGNNGFLMDGNMPFDQAGLKVKYFGDFNNDGINDIVIPSYEVNPGNLSRAGAVYFLYGHSSGFSTPIALANLDGNDGFRLDGISVDERTGIGISGAGDIDNDGFDDIVIGAALANVSGGFEVGRVYVFFGSSDSLPATISLATLDGNNGFTLEGVSAGDRTGIDVAGIGDFNGDGFDDVAIGADFADPQNITKAGSVYVVFGQNSFNATIRLADLDGVNGFRLDGVDELDSIRYVSGLGDFNQDGVDDFIIGTTSAKVNGTRKGGAYVIYGNAPPVLTSHSITIPQAGTIPLLTSHFVVSDLNDSFDRLAFDVDNVNQGHFEYADMPGVIITHFTYGDVQMNRVQFVHDNSSIAPSYDITLTDGRDTSITLSANINFVPIENTLSFNTNTISLYEGETVLLDATHLNATSIRTVDDSLIFEIQNLQHGRFYHLDQSTTAITRFNQSDIRNQKIIFVHDGSEMAPSYDVTVSDADLYTTPELAVMIIDFTQVNDPPQIVNNELTINKDETVIIDDTQLSATDEDNSNDLLNFEVRLVTHGWFERITSPDQSITEFFQSDVTNGYIRFTHDGSDKIPSYRVRVSDGDLSTSYEAAVITFQGQEVTSEDSPASRSQPLFSSGSIKTSLYQFYNQVITTIKYWFFTDESEFIKQEVPESLQPRVSNWLNRYERLHRHGEYDAVSRWFNYGLEDCKADLFKTIEQGDLTVSQLTFFEKEVDGLEKTYLSSFGLLEEQQRPKGFMAVSSNRMTLWNRQGKITSQQHPALTAQANEVMTAASGLPEMMCQTMGLLSS